MSDSRRFLLLAGAGAMAAAAVLALAVGSPRPAQEPPTATLEEGEFGVVPAFDLLDQRGRRVRRQDLNGPWVANFLFTKCSSLCPMMASRLKELEGRLGGVQVVSFSVDPSDSPEDLARFAARYQAGWLFLTGGPGVVRKLSFEGFKLAVADGRSAEDPILHTDKLVLVDGLGVIRGYYDSGDDGALERLAVRARALAADGGTAAAR